MQIIIPGIDGRLDLAVSHGPAATDEHSYNVMRLSIIASKKIGLRQGGAPVLGDIIYIIGSCACVRCSARNMPPCLFGDSNWKWFNRGGHRGRGEDREREELRRVPRNDRGN